MKKANRVVGASEVSISDLGLIAAKLEIKENEVEFGFSAHLPTAGDYREFMDLHAVLHQNFLRFGARGRDSSVDA